MNSLGELMCVPRHTVTINDMKPSLEQHATTTDDLDTQLFRKQDNHIQSQLGTFLSLF